MSGKAGGVLGLDESSESWGIVSALSDGIVGYTFVRR